MSLHNAAKHLAAHGRGDDKVLVHMTKGEVNSLNNIAMAHGGQLTINPHTGLPEAGFLSSLLPMIAGAGLMAVSGGAINPMTAGLLVGGLRTAQSGSLSKGLMAGLGAYGGAGLSGGLMSSGASAMNTQAANAVQAANPGLTAGEIGREMGTAGFTQPTIAATSNPALASGIDKFSAGVTGLGTEAGRSAALSSMGGGMGAAKIGAAAVLPSLIGEPKTPEMTPSDKDMGQRYSYTGQATQPTPAPDVMSYEDMLTKQGNFGRQQNYYPNPKTYTAIGPTEAKDLYHFANGGPVEQMSNNAAMGLNTMYPMAIRQRHLLLRLIRLLSLRTCWLTWLHLAVAQ